MQWIACPEADGFGYVEYLAFFEKPEGACTLFFSADRVAAVYVNGELALPAHYADYPFYKCVDRAEITSLLHEGENELTVLAYHPRADYAASRVVFSGIAFEIVSEGKRVLSSSKETLCRVSPRYKEGSSVTPQIGLGFVCDFGAEETEFVPAKEIFPKVKEVLRPVPRPALIGAAKGTIFAQGIFRYRGGETAAEQVQRAWLSTERFSKIARWGAKNSVKFASKGGSGVFVIVELDREAAGYPSLLVTVKKPCRAVLVWGEHLSDLRIRSAVGGRNFATELYLSAGVNELDDRIHRIGCRYLGLFVEESRFELSRLTVERDEYPFRDIEYSFDDRLLKEIFEAGKRTLRLCAHEHYEDCPWREQALYGMDSLSQMLYGYSAFGEYEFPRFNLRLIAYSLGGDGLIELCPPARASITIPSFSAYFLLAIAANAEADFQVDFVLEMLPYAERILETFIARTGEHGISTFPEPRYWNFHEWSDGLDGGLIFRTEAIEPSYDGPLTALVFRAAEKIAALEERVGRTEQKERFLEYSRRLADTLGSFYDPQKGLYASYQKDGKKEGYHCYTQSLFLLTGQVPKERHPKICRELESPKNAVKETTGVMFVKYDALLLARGEAEKEFILEDICRVFGKMLFRGTDTLWETEKGEADFEDAGSLCHGWSAVACRILPMLGAAKRK